MSVTKIRQSVVAACDERRRRTSAGGRGASPKFSAQPPALSGYSRFTGTPFHVRNIRQSPGAMLRPFVAQAYETQIPSSSASAFDFERLPEASVHIYFAAEASARAGALDRAMLRVEGPGDRLRHVTRGPVSAFLQGVELEIGAARRILGVSGASLFGSTFSLEDLWGRQAEELLDRMLSARAPAARKLVLADALLARARASTPTPRTVRAALRIIEQTRGPVRVADIAETIGVSSRQLQRHFIDEVGCAPKRYARIARLRRLVLSHDKRAPFSWADRSAELGYADQAHLISDFRAMMGAPPDRLLGRGDFVAEHLRDGWFLTPSRVRFSQDRLGAGCIA